MIVFWDVAIALIMDAVNTSETSVNFYQITRRKIPEDIYLKILCGCQSSM
jgi:hypothetical protein